jgi:hypothetical protein
LINKLFFEIKAEILKIAIFKAILNTAVVFLALATAFSLLNVAILYAFILSAIFLIINTYLYYASVSLKSIEDANPEVREMLRTAKDNMKSDNVMIRALHQELLQKARHISSGNMVSTQHLMVKLAVIAVLAFGMIFTATLNLKISDFSGALQGMQFKRTGISDNAPVNLEDTTLEDDESIYGKESIAALGNDIIQLNINPSLSELDLNKMTQEEGTQLSRTTFPVDVGKAQGAEAGTQRITEDSELVNAFYLKKLRK